MRIFLVILGAAVLGFSLWMLWGVESPELNGLTPPRASSEQDPGILSRVQQSDAQPKGPQVEREVLASRHADPKTQDEVRFDLRLPKEQRMFCDGCDPFRKRLGGRFKKEEKRLLGRAALYSEFTEGEIWRIAAATKANMGTLEAGFRPLLRTYEAKQLHFMDQRERLAQSLIEKGAYEEYRSLPVHVLSDPNRFTVAVTDSQGVVHRVATLSPGMDQDYDASVAARDESRIAMSTSVNHLLRRLHAESHR